MPTESKHSARTAVVALLVVFYLCAGVGAQQPAPAARVLPLKDVIAQVAGALASLDDPGAVYHVGSRPDGPLLQDYAATLLAAHLRHRGFPAERVAYVGGGDGQDLPGCFLHVLRVEGAAVFVLPEASLQDGERRLRTVAYEVETGRELFSMERPFHLPAALEPLVAAKRERMSQQDRKWCRLFEEMFPTANTTGFEEKVDAAEADFFYENGIWEPAGTRYLESTSPPPDVHFMRGIVSLQKAGRSQFAHAQLQDALNQHPDSGALYALGGWLMRRRNRAADALMMLEQARLVDMAREGLYVYARALSALEENDAEKAERLLTAAAEMLPEKLFAQVETARFFWNRSRLDEALHYYRRATGTEGCTAETWAELATLLDASDQPQEAVAALQQAFRLRNDSATITRHLASLLRRQGDYQGALEVLRRAAEANPCSAALLAAYGDGAAAMWLIQEAEAQFRRAAEVGQDFPYATARLAAVLALQRRYGRAQPLLTGLLARHPDYHPARLELARLLTEVEQFDEAESALNQVAKDPEHEAEARIALAELYLASGQPQEAIRS
ncbi:MAG: tetratricopeptide repeat protein, partial [Candidatus Brocadiia bacterium]